MLFRSLAPLALLVVPVLHPLPSAHAQPAPSRTITSPNPEPGGQFGYALAVLGDVDGDALPDLLVGAPEERVSEEPTDVHGRAYVFSGATGEALYTLESPSTTPQFIGFRGDFGGAVAALDDLDGDGVADFAVSAPDEVVEEETEGGGVVYVYSGATGTVLHRLAHPPARYQDLFGVAIAALGDLDGDGVGDVGVGAEDSGEQLACDQLGTTGLAYAFSGATGALLYTLAPEAGCETYFGTSIAGLGDVDGDGRADFAVGSLGDAGGAPFIAGRVHTFSGATGERLYVLESPAPAASGLFGSRHSLTVRPDLDGDGALDLVVGAQGEAGAASGLTSAGQAYAVSSADGSLISVYASPDPVAGGGFGSSTGPSGDLDGDGTADVLISAWGESVAAEGLPAGRVYAFSGATGNVLFTLDSPTPQPYGSFGEALDGTADLTGDGRPEVLVGQPDSRFSNAPDTPGRVFVFGALPIQTEPRAPAARSLAVHPNPAVDRLYISLEGSARLAAYDLLGREFAVLDDVRGHAVLDVSGWAPGLYVLRMDGADGAEVRRFTVAR